VQQATSTILKTSFLFIALAACQEIGKGTINVTHPSSTPKQTVATTHTKPAAKKKKKKIYLTFDDGPNKGTFKVLRIVQQEAVPVSFFVIGEHVFASVGQQQTWDSLKMAKQIELCNHSYTHAWHNRYDAYYNNPDSVVQDFKKSRDSLQLDNDIGRTPGRNTWRIDTLQYTDLKRSKAAVDSLQHAGFAIMGWDLEWHYNGKTLCTSNTADDLMRQIDSVFAHHRTRMPEHLVLLAHDQVYADANDSAELHSFIRKLKGRDDYELELVSKYPGIKPNATDTMR
jgi:peptidoglycan/xylan/chitin deacetylase (PgdA/CDA1 family)